MNTIDRSAKAAKHEAKMSVGERSGASSPGNRILGNFS